MWRRRHVMDDLDRGHLVRRRQQIIHQALCDALTLRVISELLIERRPDTVGDAAYGHAAYDFWIDHGAAIMADEVPLNLRLSEIRIDHHEQEVKLEGEARIHLHAAISGRQ